jgi:hypothetical protein
MNITSMMSLSKLDNTFRPLVVLEPKDKHIICHGQYEGMVFMNYLRLLTRASQGSIIASMLVMCEENTVAQVTAE